MSSILIVDDEETIAWGLARLAREEGHHPRTVASGEEALELAAESSFDLVFLDVRLPGVDGLTVMPALASSPGMPKVVVMTAFGDLNTAVDAYGGGAYDYLVKPFGIDAAIHVMRRALTDRCDGADSDESLNASVNEIIGNSPAIQEVFKRIALVAPAEASVVISGESGTGKELVARAIHRYSSRRDGPFVAIHLAALSPALIESELFGHRRGAYTGADESKIGLLETAAGGTAFLDEVSEVPLDIQVKLLRAIEQQEVVPVGETAPRRIDVRIAAATNRDLRREMLCGRFREDLYYRLATFEIMLPPLRQRGDDIELLARHFLARYGHGRLWFSPVALQSLRNHAWPGNVRQLRNVVHTAVLLARTGEIGTEHLSLGESSRTDESALENLRRAVTQWAEDRLTSGVPGELYHDFLRAAEHPLFRCVLDKTNNNRAEAAELLGIHRATLRKKL